MPPLSQTGTPLRILLLEDSEDDALLITRHLRKAEWSFSLKRVDSRESFEAAVTKESWDIILSDFSVPLFNGMEALQFLQEKSVQAPFIMISGRAGEETAVEAMRAGAHDYILKSNLYRLIPAIERELRDEQDRRAHRQAQEALQESEARFRLMADASPLMIWMTNSEGICNYVNRAWLEFTGQGPSLDHENCAPWMHPEDA